MNVGIKSAASLACLVMTVASAHAVAGNETQRISVDSSGGQANGQSFWVRVSGNGRYACFSSDATNLVAADTNGARDVFVRDLETGETTRVSVDSSGNQGDGASRDPSISYEGRYVAFKSFSANLVPGDGNTSSDIFVHDRVTAVTRRVSVDSAGAEANGNSDVPSMASQGGSVGFHSSASNLVVGDTNGAGDVFVHDLKTGVTTRVSVDSSGLEADAESDVPVVSSDGRLVAFRSAASNLVPGDTNGVQDVFVHDRLVGSTQRVSVASNGDQGDGRSGPGALSEEGRFLVFDSLASNLVGGDTNSNWDVFVRDLVLGTTSRASVSSLGAEAHGVSSKPSISPRGRYVAFESTASDLVSADTNGVADVFLHDRQTGLTTRVSTATGGGQGDGASASASVAFASGVVAFESSATNLVSGDTNGVLDVFVFRDLASVELVRASIDSDEQQSSQDANFPLAVSGDGRFAAFNGDLLVAGDTNGEQDIYVRDLAEGLTTRASVRSDGGEANGRSYFPAVSRDGRYVAFSSEATNLVAGDTNAVEDVFRHDRSTGETIRVSVSSAGVEGNGRSGDWPGWASISADGRLVAFVSLATNLVAGDANNRSDVFVHDAVTGVTTFVTVDSQGQQTNGWTEWAPSISADGRFVAFCQGGTNLVPGDTNGENDIFVHDRQAGTTERVSVSSTGAEGNGRCEKVAISGDGRHVAFISWSDNLVDGDNNGIEDVFVHDRVTGVTLRASVDSSGGQSYNSDPDTELFCSISGDGRFVVFDSWGKLHPDADNRRDIYRHDCWTGVTELLNVSNSGVKGDDCYAPVISGDGQTVVFFSRSDKLVEGDSNNVGDVFARLQCEVEFESLGVGHAGSGDFVPVLSGVPGSCLDYTVSASDCLGGTFGLLAMGGASDEFSLYGGQFYLDLSETFLWLPVSIGGPINVPGAGGFLLPGSAKVRTFLDVTVFLQLLVYDPGASHGVSLSNALALSIED